MTKKIYPLKFYTKSGHLTPPIYFHYALLFLARTWGLLIISIVSRESGDALLNIFYPDKLHFYLGLASGSIAIVLFFISGRLHKRANLLCRIWSHSYPFLLLCIVVDLLLQLYYLYLNRFQYSIEASMQLVFIIWILLFCINSKHLKESFRDI